MRDDMERVAARWGVPIAVALLAIAVRALMSSDKTTLLGLSRNVVVGLFVGAVVNLYLADTSWLTDGQRGAVVGVSAVLAEDLVAFVLRLARRLRDDPLAIVNWFLTSFTRFPAVPVKRRDGGEQ